MQQRAADRGGRWCGKATMAASKLSNTWFASVATAPPRTTANRSA
ncbi:MAG: hypothetical protein M5U09_02810 [Gammaproteobacteria bacterium]|nr:hypothetical protein [Gammaproteobacteria bacterium]